MYKAVKPFKSRVHGEFTAGDPCDHLPPDAIASFVMQRLVDKSEDKPAPLAVGRKRASSRPARVSPQPTASLSDTGAISDQDDASLPSTDLSSSPHGPTYSTRRTQSGGDSIGTSGLHSPESGGQPATSRDNSPA
jgi:hypothetical protein